MFCNCGQKPWKIRFKDIYIEILANTWNKPEVTILKKPQEELINWYLLFATPIHHRSVMLMSYAIQTCSIREIGYEVELTPKIEFPSCVSHFMATYHGILVTASWMSYWRFSFLVVASNFIKWIQNSCTESNFILFRSFCLIGFRSVDMFDVFVLKFLLWIRQLLFQHLETFLSSCLSGLLFSNVFNVFLMTKFCVS